MRQGTKRRTWPARAIDRWQARKAARLNVTTRFITPPEPRIIGSVARGQQMIAGKFLFSGILVQGMTDTIWNIAADYPALRDEIHSFAWLDDLVAIGDRSARNRAQQWLFDWIERYGDGRQAGWTPALTAQRLPRWINHGLFLLAGQNKVQKTAFYQSLARQAVFLSRRWQSLTGTLASFETQAAVIQTGLVLDEFDTALPAALAALSASCDAQIDAGGAIATRNPEELMQIFCLLNWTVQDLAKAGHDTPPALQAAMVRCAPTLRALRHADGALARFHGGGHGRAGQLDAAFAAARIKAVPSPGLQMGYGRLTGGRTTVIADAAAPPDAATARAHASTLGFEMTSGRRPVIANCGHGARFGPEWRRASRTTPHHSTLAIDGGSSATITAPAHTGNIAETLTDRPTTVHAECRNVPGAQSLQMSHNGFQPAYGLTHMRTLRLSHDGRMIAGEDMLAALDKKDEAIFDRAQKLTGIPYTLRFHLHPDVTAHIDSAAGHVSLTLTSGETWMLSYDGQADISLAPSVYLQNSRFRPQATQQVVFSGHAITYATRMRWLLAKAQDTPNALRDLVQADLADAVD